MMAAQAAYTTLFRPLIPCVVNRKRKDLCSLTKLCLAFYLKGGGERSYIKYVMHFWQKRFSVLRRKSTDPQDFTKDASNCKLRSAFALHALNRNAECMMHVIICFCIIYLAAYTEHTCYKIAILSIPCQSHVCMLVSAMDWPWLSEKLPHSA